MNKTTIIPAATPYAEALIKAARGGHLVDEDHMDCSHDLLTEINPDLLTEDINTILTIISPINKIFENYFASPKIDGLTKKNFLKKIFENQITNFTLNFLLLLVDRRRINILYSIVNKCLELRNNERIVVEFDVTSVVALSVEQETDLIEKLKLFSGAKDVKLTMKQDSTILAGLLVQSGSKFIDLSINGELRNLSNYLGSDFEF